MYSFLILSYFNIFPNQSPAVTLTLSNSILNILAINSSHLDDENS